MCPSSWPSQPIFTSDGISSMVNSSSSIWIFLLIKIKYSLFSLPLKKLAKRGWACIVDFLMFSLNLNSIGVSHNSGKKESAFMASSLICSGIILFSKLTLCAGTIERERYKSGVKRFVKDILKYQIAFGLWFHCVKIHKGFSLCTEDSIFLDFDTVFLL